MTSLLRWGHATRGRGRPLAAHHSRTAPCRQTGSTPMVVSGSVPFRRTARGDHRSPYRPRPMLPAMTAPRLGVQCRPPMPMPIPCPCPFAGCSPRARWRWGAGCPVCRDNSCVRTGPPATAWPPASAAGRCSSRPGTGPRGRGRNTGGAGHPGPTFPGGPPRPLARGRGGRGPARVTTRLNDGSARRRDATTAAAVADAVGGAIAAVDDRVGGTITARTDPVAGAITVLTDADGFASSAVFESVATTCADHQPDRRPPGSARPPRPGRRGWPGRRTARSARSFPSVPSPSRSDPLPTMMPGKIVTGPLCSRALPRNLR